MSSAGSSSSSSSSFHSSFDVFVSYRGIDSNNFKGHLIKDLRHKGLNVFRDDEFARGELLSPVFYSAIEGSRAAIIVFSMNYATSKWCLNELVKILECRERNKQLVWPIFYKVDPSVVRNQRKRYSEALKIHENLFRDQPETVENWRKALRTAANLSGWAFPGGNAPNFIEEVTKEVSRQLARRACLHVAEHPVGLDSRVAELNSILNIENKDDVQVVAIYGPKGVGKTTIAKDVYNSIADEFEGSSFLRDVGKCSNLDMIRLQETLLSEILREKIWMVGSVDRGIKLIQERLCTKRVLIVLDDVNVRNQLHSLAGEPIRLGKGSRIIITTGNKNLINFLKVSSTSIYEVKKLDSQEALKLLCLYAFKNEVAPNGYADVAKCVVDFSQGIPLELVELGPLLYGKSVDEWTVELDRYKNHCSLEDNGKIVCSQESTEEQGPRPSTSDEIKAALHGQEPRRLGLNGSLYANHLALQPSDNHPSCVTFEMQEGIFVEIGEGSKSFKQEKWKGKKSSMIRARGHSIVRGSEPTFWRPLPESRVFEDAELNYVYSLDIKGNINTDMSVKTIYGAYLIFKFVSPQHSFEMKPVDLSVKLEGDEDSSDGNEFLVRLSKVQGDGWMEIEIGEFFNDDVEDGSVVCSNIEIDSNVTKAGLVIQGIEIRPKDKMGSEMDSSSWSSLDELTSLSLGSPTSERTGANNGNFLSLNNPEVDMKSNVPFSSFFNLTSKKDDFVHLYDHAKLIENGNMRIEEDKSSGKMCCMVSARGLNISSSDRPTYWSWISILQSRFPLVAKLNIVYYFNIEVMIETQWLSPGTTYAAYFLFKFEELISGFREQPLRSIIDCEGKDVQECNIFLDPSENEPRLCRKREDGWMEINMGEFFINSNDSSKIKCSLKEHNTSIRKTGLIVEGIEFRPKESDIKVE